MVESVAVQLDAEVGTGDLILTGTPGGVGAGRQPARFLQPGELLVTAIDGFGELRNPIT